MRTPPMRRNVAIRIAPMKRERTPIHVAVIAAVLVVTGVDVAVAAAPLEPRDFQRAAASCQNGMKALGSGDLPKAREQYQKAVALVPSFPDGHVGLANVLMKEGKFEEALKEYEKARDGFAELGDAIFDIQAKRYNETQRQIATLRDNMNALQRPSPGTSTADPTQVERHVVELEDRIRNLEAIQMPSKDAPREPPGEIFFYMGNAQFRLGRLDDALKSWETCATKSPKFAMVHNNLAVAYWKKGRIEDAKKSLSQASELGFPVNPQFRADLERSSVQPAPGPPPAKP